MDAKDENRATSPAWSDTEAKEKGWIGTTPLLVAARKGHKALCLALVAARAYKDAKDGDGCTPLHMAAFKDLDALALALVEGTSFWGRLWATFPLFRVCGWMDVMQK